MLVLLVEHQLVVVLAACRAGPAGSRCRAGGTCLPCRTCAIRRARSARCACRGSCRAASICRICTNAIVVEISRSSVLFRKRSNAGELRHRQRGRPCAGARAGSRRAPCAARACTRAPASRRRTLTYGTSSSLSSGTGIWKRSRKRRIASIVHLLLLVRDVLRLAGLAHAVALDRLGEDDRRLALVLDGRVVRRVDLVRIVAAAVQVPDVLVGPVGDQRLQLGRVEEVLAHVRAVLAT